MIKLLVTHHVPAVFTKSSRVQLIAQTADEFQVSERWVKTLLLRAFHGGMVRGSTDSLLNRCGGKNKPRPAPPGSVKRGRKVRHGSKEGVNIDADMARMFNIAADRWAHNAKLDMPAAYRLCMKMFFVKEVDELESIWPKYIPTEEYEKAGLPRFAQFRYHVLRDRERMESERRRLGARKWDMKNRALLSDSTLEAWGPGARFQIDATVIDVYIRSRRSTKGLLGRATLYVVIDVFSRMIVGFSLSLDPPSWQAAMTALANAVTDKVKFCAKYGITIQEEDWPCKHICAILEGDRGEIEGSGILGAIDRFSITVENAAAFRADWKGIVEARFRTLQADWKPYVEGYVDSDFQERGSRDYRLDAVLDIDDLTRIIIRQILYFNNYHELKDYPHHPAMTEDGVPAVPRELWRWGIANVGGLPRSPREDIFLFSLLPTAQASITAKGIYYHGVYYTCPFALEKRWFEQARKKRSKVTISYDKRDVDRIFVHIPELPDGFQVAELTESSGRKKGWNGWEVEDDIRKRAAISADHRDIQTLQRIGMEAANEAEVKRARAEYDAMPDHTSSSEQLKGIRARTSEEREFDRMADAADYQARMGVRSLEHGAAAASVPEHSPGLPKNGARNASPSMRALMEAAARKVQS